MNNVGYIYKITNNINGKSYIGQTKHFYEYRWNEHKCRYLNKNSKAYNISLYRAFRKYGINNFLFEVIEECDISNLNKREMFWIKHFNTFDGGYNETLGGDGSKLYDIDENLIIDLYKKNKTIKSVVKLTKYPKEAVVSVLKKNNIHIFKASEHQKQKGNHIIVYSLNKELLTSFNSRFEVGEWLILNGISNAKNPLSAGYRIVRNLRNDIHICCGLLWFYENNNFVDSFEFDFIQDTKLKKTNICPNCGKYKNINSKQCFNCYNNEKGKKSKIVDKNILIEDLEKLSFVDIGLKYGVSDNTVRKWCKKYNLPYRKYK